MEILHPLGNALSINGGKADRKIPQSLGETWFQNEDEIFIDRHKFETLIDGINAFIKEFRVNPHKFIHPLPKNKRSGSNTNAE